MMTPLLWLLLILICSPAAIFIAHIAWHHVATIGGRHVTGHQSAMRAMVVVFVLVLAAGWKLVLQPSLGQPLEVAAGLVYIVALYVPMALLYVNIINIAETSLHMHTLLEVRLAGELSPAVLCAKYDAPHMVAARLDRLTSLGQIRTEGGRYHLASHLVLWFAETIVFWHHVIAVPLPELYLKRS
jgi:hypothetical protein